MATLRGRLGMTTGNGNTLWYVTGGGAWAHGNRMIVNSVVGVTSFTTGSHAGWTAGAGVEHALNSHWSVKGEYLYADLGPASYFDAGSGVTTSVDVKVHTLRFGINRKF